MTYYFFFFLNSFHGLLWLVFNIIMWHTILWLFLWDIRETCQPESVLALLPKYVYTKQIAQGSHCSQCTCTEIKVKLKHFTMYKIYILYINNNKHYSFNRVLAPVSAQAPMLWWLLLSERLLSKYKMINVTSCFIYMRLYIDL